MNQYDVTVIGSGPGGYVAAIRCAQLGLKTALIEKYDTLGGTCLNVGCIPSKALLDSSEHYHNAHSVFQEHGIELNDLRVNMPQMNDRKNGVVKANTDGIVYLMKKNKIDVLHGLGSFVDKTHIKIVPTGGGEEQQIETKNVIIATGSKPTVLPFISQDQERIITSTEALNIREVPKSFIVIGGGVIGLEMASIYARLGAEVTVIEYTDALVPTMDSSIGKELKRVLGKIGIKFMLGHKVTGATREGDVVTVTATTPKGEEVKVAGDYCLVAVGRSPYTAGVNLEAAGIEMEERGRIKVDAHLQTNVPGIYAIGDVVRGAMLAHKAEEEGVFVAETIAGQKPHINYLLIPGVVYTWPEAAGVGYTEEQLKQEGRAYKTGNFPFRASGRARASGDLDGFVKVLADKTTDEILGVHMVGPRIADLIAEAVTAMEFRASAEDVARMSHAHPTYAEAMKEACLAATENRAIHM
ncbi:dihydrolipoyl dehydrogenase [Hymenobacter rubripertinctus]|uniref:Dihydrolipoyl dehydrogenase n=1 Tax=Hymenobacter rubripertinctus TaxID=2029981 RepID=A0A418QXY1_9BACT|nr:dihydrolipoyl dehydrogenase [Hymenobacter rubripertinctus]RIY10014.1 dihydrolipoyl dehydrogenase [Hymenobacter rubripertinctus]